MPVYERIQLVEDTFDGIAEDAGPLSLSAEEREELDRRLAEHHANPSSSIPWDEVRASLFEATFDTSTTPICAATSF